MLRLAVVRASSSEKAPFARLPVLPGCLQSLLLTLETAALPSLAMWTLARSTTSQSCGAMKLHRHALGNER